MSFEERYATLNPEQKQAVDSIDGPVLVVAGPGSGKTEILSLRVATILRKTDTRPGSILCLTFTDSAALNMRARLGKLIGTDSYRVSIHTFHSFGTLILNRYPEYFFGGGMFNPADEVVQLEVLSELFGQLPYDNPLRSEHPEQGFVYLKAVSAAISHIKRGGLSPEEFAHLLAYNVEELAVLNPVISDIFEERLSKASFLKVERLLEKLKKLETKRYKGFDPLSAAIASSLTIALERAKEDDKTTPLSEWKEKHTRKTESGRVLMESEYTEKMNSLASLYAAYQKEMYTRGYFDFDDMILEVITALEKNETLRLSLEEEFQYILVDEFQDTNDAQVRLLSLLTSSPVHNGRPNIMVVGDDDQAIFKFQGAEARNVVRFVESYRDVQRVLLSKNYRSTQNIIDFSRSLLEAAVNSKKHLVAHEPGTGTITSRAFRSLDAELCWVAGEVRRLIDTGTSPADIAIISRTHAVLESALPYLTHHNIPLVYERQSDVLQEKHIQELIMLARFLHSAYGQAHAEDSLLPAILASSYWGIPRKLIWEVSLAAGSSRGWLKTMQEFPDERVQKVGRFLGELAVFAQSEPLSRTLDVMIGSSSLSYDDDAEGVEVASVSLSGFTSPFKSYYFAEEKKEYITFLESLRTFVATLREYKKGSPTTLADLVHFVDVYEKNNLSLANTTILEGKGDMVTLLSAHKAKGLEFPIVFVVSLTQDIWKGSIRGERLPFPSNLPLRPGSDDESDVLRLLYVALTRSKHTLYLSHHTTNIKGKETLPLAPLVSHVFTQTEVSLPEIVPTLSTLSSPPFVPTERAFLERTLLDYKMSVTHLNNFLDVVSGGPALFREQNLLRFPQAKSVSSVFGSAMHASLAYVFRTLRRDGVLPHLSSVLKIFEEEIRRGHLGSADERVSLERGIASLTLYYSLRSDRFLPECLSEIDFANEGVVLGEARMTGKIDKMIEHGQEVEVVDFKTGKAKLSWDEKGETANQLYKYHTQLLFYKILVEHSHRFAGHTVTSGSLEFLEPVDGAFIDLPLVLEEKEVQRLKRLIEVVYAKIQALDFPDISRYEKTLTGRLDFENDLLEGKI